MLCKRSIVLLYFISIMVACCAVDVNASMSTGIPVLQGDNQQKFISGMNTVFSGREQNRLGWGTSAVHIALIFGAGMLLAGVIAFLFNYVNSFRKKEEELVVSNSLFLDKAKKYELTEDEIATLTLLLSHQKVLEPHTIYQSIHLFEKCMDIEVNRLLQNGQWGGPDGNEEKILSSIRRKLGYSQLALEHPLVSSRNISLGQTGTLFAKEGTKPLFRKVSVVDNNSFFFSIQYDVEKEDVYKIIPGHIVRFVFARQTDGLYGVQVKVANVNEPGSLDLSHTMEMKRNQLRQYVRIETNLPLRIRLLSTKDAEKSEMKRGDVVTTKMSDISGGGLSFMFDKSLRINDLVSINFDLPNSAFAGIVGKIVHLTLREGKNGTLIKHHIQFVDLEPRKRELIIKYVFEKERQLSQWR